jgi:hypothetical protein
VLLGAGLSNVTTFVSSNAKIVATEDVMTGQAHFNVTIDKAAKVDAPGKARPENPAVVPAPVKPDAAKPTPAPPAAKPDSPTKPDAPNKPDAEPGK